MTEPDEPRDTPDLSVDDQFRELLEGLRTTLPGVVVLFAFLLALPLTAEFGTLDNGERVAFDVAFFSSAIASALLIAPSVHQRLRAPLSGLTRRSKRHLRFTVTLTIGGTICFAAALAAGVLLVSMVVFERLAGTIAAGAVTALVAWSWFYVPLVTFREKRRPARR